MKLSKSDKIFLWIILLMLFVPIFWVILNKYININIMYLVLVEGLLLTLFIGIVLNLIIFINVFNETMGNRNRNNNDVENVSPMDLEVKTPQNSKYFRDKNK